MSKQAVEAFLQKLRADSSLSEQATALKPSIPAIVDLAQQLGYEFSADEFLAVTGEKNAQPGDAELTEDGLALASGAGGGWDEGDDGGGGGSLDNSDWSYTNPLPPGLP